MNLPIDLDQNFVVIDDNLAADVLPVGDNFYAELGERYGSFAGHMLVSCHHFSRDWPTWEMHPSGDEIVVLTSGRAIMVFAAPDSAGDQEIELREPGQFVVVPKGTWHTAKVNNTASMIFMTPGEGTENREQPMRAAHS